MSFTIANLHSNMLTKFLSESLKLVCIFDVDLKSMWGEYIKKFFLENTKLLETVIHE